MTGQKFTLEVNPSLPPSLERLAELATNLRFSWHRPTRKLFETLDEDLWAAVSGNPRLFLRCIGQAALDRAATSESFLVLFDAYSEGWGVTVDGVTDRVLRADVCFRGVRLSGGAHRVVFSYRPPGVRDGLLLGLLGIFLLAAFSGRRPGSSAPPRSSAAA